MTGPVGLAAELRALRAAAGLTLRELSLEVHVSDSSLSRYFAGQALPPWPVVAALADLGGGDHTELRRLWEGAQRERKQARWPAPAAPPDRRLVLVGVAALMAASGVVGWLLAHRFPGRSRGAFSLAPALRPAAR
jgi:transcriptional regulator with XRE-family HTH domain